LAAKLSGEGFRNFLFFVIIFLIFYFIFGFVCFFCIFLFIFLHAEDEECRVMSVEMKDIQLDTRTPLARTHASCPDERRAGVYDGACKQMCQELTGCCVSLEKVRTKHGYGEGESEIEAEKGSCGFVLGRKKALLKHKQEVSDQGGIEVGFVLLPSLSINL
jgi:hypothetical protein